MKQPSPIEMVDDVQSLWWKGKPIVMTLISEYGERGTYYRYYFKYHRKEMLIRKPRLNYREKPQQTLIDVLMQEAFTTTYNNYHRAHYYRQQRKLMKMPKGKPYLTPLARMLGGISELRQFRTYLREQKKEGNI